METTYTLDELEDAYRQHDQAAGHTAATQKRHQATFNLFRQYLGARGLAPGSRVLTSQQMQGFAIWLQDTPIAPRKGTTVRATAGCHAHLRDMRAFGRWLLDAGYLTVPIKVPLPRLPETLFPIMTNDELERVWTSRYLTGKSSMAIRNRALVGLMLDSGLRRAEVANLELQNLDLADCLVTVTGKGNKQRRVPFSTSVGALIKSWLDVRGMEPGRLFWLAPQSVKTVFQRIKDELGLKNFHPHLLRHQAATMMVRNNADLASVQRILGHSDISTTLQYLSLTDADLRAKHAAASPYDSFMKASETIVPARRKRLSLKE